MLKYRGKQLIRFGILGIVVIILTIAVGLQPEKLLSWATAVRYSADFAEAGGLVVGNDVRMSGMKIGTVSDISLTGAKVSVTFAVDSKVGLGSQTTAHIQTETLLGQRVLELRSAGDGTLRPLAVIPLSRTSSPYSLTDAVGDLTTNTSGTDTQSINQSLDTLSETIDRIAPQLGPTFDGLSRLSRSMSSRDGALRELLSGASQVSGIIGEHSQQLNTLILNANDLVAVLNARRHAIVTLLSSISVVSDQLSGVVADNEKELAPALAQLNSVTAMLERNRDNIAKALPGFAKYQMTLGEAVANGYYYNAYEPNLLPLQFMQPFFDYAFGFRRGVNQGQPPDNVGPRAEIPLPFNGIPGGSR